MSQTRVIDLSAINKNLSIRFRSKFRKQSEGSISNYLRAISLARTFPNYLRAASIIAWAIAKKGKRGGGDIFLIINSSTWSHFWSLWSENVVCVIILIKVVITWGAVLWSVKQKLSVITSDGLPSSQVWAGTDAAGNWVNQLKDANPRWAARDTLFSFQFSVLYCSLYSLSESIRRC